MLGTLTVTALTLAPPANAAATVQIDDVRFESETVADGTRQSLHVDWSIPARASNPVTLSVDFPDGMKGYPDSFAMKGPGGVDAGQCQVTVTSITCTVDPAFINANPYGVSGTFWFDVSTDLRNEDTTEHIFDFGGQSVPVTVEPNPDYCDEVCEFAGYRFKKYGSYNSLDDTISWTVRLPAPEEGIEAGKNIVISDDLDTSIFELLDNYDGEQWPQLWEGRCLRLNSSNEEVPRWIDRTDDIGDVWNADRTSVSFTSRAGAMGGSCVEETTGSFYLVEWKVKVKDLGKAGTYENKASYSIDGETPVETTGKTTRRSGGGDVDGTNFGSFQVTKELNGSAQLNPAFSVDYEAYDGATKIDEGTFDIKEGQSYLSQDYFDGTRVVLKEPKPTAPANVTWADPQFVGPDGLPVDEYEITFSAANDTLDKVTQIRLVNNADLIDADVTARKVIENPDNIALDKLPSSYRIAWGQQARLDLGVANAYASSFNLPADGSTVTLDDVYGPNTRFHAGLPYFFEETPPVAPAGTSWDTPEIVVNGATILAGEDYDTVLPTDGSPVEMVVTNRITQDVGGFTVDKAVSGTGENLVPAGTEFTVDYSYPSVNGFPAGSGSVKVTAGQTSPVVGDLPVGAVVTLDEARPVDPIGGTWGQPQFDIAQFTVLKDQTIAISLDNPITWNDGDFSITKKVTGDGASLVGDDVAFTVDYTYSLPDDLGVTPGNGEGTLTAHNDGTAVISAPLPYGTEVTLAEDAPAQIQGGTWTGSQFDHKTFTIGDKTTFEVILTNTIDLNSGVFTISKKIDGNGKKLVDEDATFTVDYTYPAGSGFAAGSGSIKVKADGTAVASPELPYGAKVALTEQKPRSVEGARWTDKEFSTDTVTVGDGTNVEVVLTNTLTKDKSTGTDDPGTDDDDTDNSGALPDTGANGGLVPALIAAFFLLGVGGYLTLVGRRRKA